MLHVYWYSKHCPEGPRDAKIGKTETGWENRNRKKQKQNINKKHETRNINRL